jgi:Dolichyl-phosphate-mannose-protein mannosyltransferase
LTSAPASAVSELSSAIEDRAPADVHPSAHYGGALRYGAVWLAAATLFVAARALPVISNVPGRDEGTYLTIGRSVLQGRILYRDLWDNKPPGIFYLYGLIGKIFGARMWGVAAVDFLLLLVVSWCVFFFVEKFLGPAGAAVAVAVQTVWHVEAGYIFTAQPEFFQLPLIIGAYFLVSVRTSARTRWRYLLAGVVLGAAFWIKYNAILFLPLLLLPCLQLPALDERPPRLALNVDLRAFAARAFWILAGFSAVITAVLVYFALHGALAALRQIQFEVLPRYAAMAAERRRLPLGQWIAVRSEFFLGAATLWVTIAALVIAWRRRDLARAGPLFVAAALAYAATAVQGSFHSYYFATCYPFFAAMWAYLAVNVWEASRAAARACKRRRWRVAQVLVWVLFANVVFWPLPAEFSRAQMDYESLCEWRANPENFYAHHPWEIPFEHVAGQLAVIHYLRAKAAPGDRMYLWGGHSLICYLAGPSCVTRFVSNLGLMSLWTPPAWRAEVAGELSAQPPRWIVVARDDALPSITYVYLTSDQYLKQRFPALKNLIAAHYRLAADFTTFAVYRRSE